ncbi:MAG: TolC family protein [bacterium]
MRNIFFLTFCIFGFFGLWSFFPAQVTSQPLSLSLQGAIDLALQRNPEVLATAKQVDAAKGRSWQAWWPEDPEFALEYEGVPRGKGLSNYQDRFISFNQSIDFPTNILLQKRIAGKEVEITRMECELAKLDLMSRVKTAYFNLLTKWERLSLAHQNLQLAKDFLQKAQIRYEVGEGTHLEYVKAKVEKARAENDLTLAQNGYDIALAELNLLLVRDSGAEITPSDSLRYVPLDISVRELKDRAFRVHPEIKAMDLKVEAAQSGRTLAWSSFLPELHASYFNQNIDGNPNFWGVEFGISVPLWFPFRQRGQIREANADLAQARFKRENLKNRLALQIESAWLKVKAAEKLVLLYKEELLAEADEVYRIALRSYEEGESSYLELLEARRTLIESQAGHIESLFTYNSALAELERAVGARLTF